MAQFNFTVRATDSEGSFADRSFNITVRNSKIERYMAINTTDAYTSSDGTTWTQRPGMGGYSCAYGNGFWLINSDDGLRKSYDGVNYNFIPSASLQVYDDLGTLLTSGNGAASLTSGSSAKIRSFGNKFYLPWQGNVGGTSKIGVFVSTDGVTWNYKSALIGTVTNNLSGGYYFTITEDNGTLFMNHPWTAGTQNLGYMSTDAGETWTIMADIAGSTTRSGVLRRFNGLYLTTIGTTTAYQYSTDGSNWTTGSFGTLDHQVIWDFSYANGKLYAFFNKSTTAAAPQIYLTSVDGINWTTNTYKTFKSSSQNSANSNVIPIYKNGIFIIGGSSGLGSDDSDTTSVPSGGLRLSTNGTDWVTVNRYDDTSTTFTDVAMM